MASEADRISLLDARLRVVAATLEPAFVFARAMRLELADLAQLVSIGYFRELRGRGLSWEGIARRLGKSRRTVASLARAARSEQPLLEQSERVRLRRRTVQVVARLRAATRDNIAAELTEASAVEVQATIDELLEQGLLERDEDGVRVATEVLDLVASDFHHRLDSLRHFFDGLTHVIHRRFFGDPGVALARVYTFAATPDRLRALCARLEQELREEAIDADAEAADDPTATQVTLGVYVVERSRDLPFRGRR